MPKSKYRKISNISGEDFSFQKPYSLPDRLKKKINNLYENLNETFISEIENAITTYKFEEAVFRRAPTYTDIRIQLDEILGARNAECNANTSCNKVDPVRGKPRMKIGRRTFCVAMRRLFCHIASKRNRLHKRLIRYHLAARRPTGLSAEVWS